MRFPDLTKSHIDSPAFRRDLKQLERDTDSLGTSCQSIISILVEKAALARRDTQLSKQLIREIQSVGMSHIVELDKEGVSSSAIPSHERISKKISAFTTISSQLCENQDIYSEQIEIGLIQPLKLFVNTQLTPVISTREEYKNACRKINMLQDRFSQVKRHEISQMGELSYQLFDMKIYKHQLVCKYLSNLHSLHTCRLPECLERLTQYLLTSSSYHNLCSSLLATSQDCISSLYKASQSISENIQGKQRSVELESERIIAEVAQDLAIGLLSFQVSDIHLPYPTALANTRRHLSINRKNLPPISPEIFQSSPLVNPNMTRDNLDTSEVVKRLAKCGYLNCGETKTFSVNWKKHFFWIESNALMQHDNRTSEQKCILNLKLSTVKSVTTTEVDRNFCFKVISPTLTLLMQTESSRDVEEWVEAINFGIRQAFNTHKSTTAVEGKKSRDERRSSLNNPESPLTPVTGVSTQTLSEIYAMPGNDKCVDCMRRAPKWASINLGVVLCIDCSGHHRGLGVHLSQIRSLILDSIKPEWIITISAMGNTKFNSVFEANLSEEVKIELVKNERNLKEFVTDKYQNLKFCDLDEREKIMGEREQLRLQYLEKYCSEKEFDLVTQSDIDTSRKLGVKSQFEGLIPSRSPSPRLSYESSYTHSVSTESLRNKVRSVSGSIGQTIARIGSTKKS